MEGGCADQRPGVATLAFFFCGNERLEARPLADAWSRHDVKCLRSAALALNAGARGSEGSCLAWAGQPFDFLFFFFSASIIFPLLLLLPMTGARRFGFREWV